MGGQVTGNSTGALGELSISGLMREGHVTATLRPKAESSARFWGTLEGKFYEQIIHGTMRLASGDTRLVREAKFSLHISKE
jgi:hypothetical protein